ncbi:MAG: YceI family protein [Gemmatimonadota bacterium]|nr:YceI family protein [Gemmatimonadota bacterium]
MNWNIDPAHSHIQFSVRHMGLSTVRGTFGELTGTISEDDGAIVAVNADVDVNSINTNSAKRDEHLRSADFFDVTNFPTAHFRLTKSERAGEAVTVVGDLTIRGVTKPVTLKGELHGPAKDPWGNSKVSASLEGKFSRAEWGLVWNQTLETGGLLVSDEVKLTIDVQAAAAVTAPAEAIAAVAA